MDAATIVRSSAPSWAAVSAWGAGLLGLALGAGMTTSAGGAARGARAALILIGTCGLGWGAVTLARGRVIAPRAGVVGSLAGLIAAVIALSLDPARTSVAAVAAASALLVATALAAASQLRRHGRATAPAAQPRLGVLLIAAVIVAAVVTPALGATEAGRLAPDHSEHGLLFVPGHQH